MACASSEHDMQRQEQEDLEEMWQNWNSLVYKVVDKIYDYYDGEERDMMVKQCRSSVETCCNFMHNYVHDGNMMQEAIQAFEEEDGARVLKEIFNEKKADADPPVFKPETEISVKNLLKVIEDAEKRVEGASDGADATEVEMEGEDLLVTGVHLSTICPLSQKEMENPVMSMKCKHTFDRAAIMAMLANKHQIQCPMQGCIMYITKIDLVPNMEMKRAIEEKK